MAQCNAMVMFDLSGAVCMQVWRSNVFQDTTERKECVKKCIKRVLEAAEAPLAHISGTLCHGDLKAVYKRYGAVYFMAFTEPSVTDWVILRLLETYHRSITENMGKVNTITLKTNFDKVLSILNGCLVEPFSRLTPVKTTRGDASACRVVMNNVKGPFTAGEKVSFAISTVGAGEGELCAEVEEEGCIKPQEVRVQQLTETMYRVTYKTIHKGEFLMRITFDGGEIEGSPFSFTCTEQEPEANQCKADGKGLHSVKQGKEGCFHVQVPNCNSNKLQVNIKSANGRKRSSSRAFDEALISEPSPDSSNTYNVKYTAPQPGDYEIHTLWDKVHIPGSPFKIKCHPLADPQKFTLDATGPVRVGKRFTCRVYTSEGTDSTAEMTAVIIGPQHTVINKNVVESKRNNDFYSLSFTPNTTGRYSINVYADGNHIHGSPFKLRTFAPEGVCAHGPGLVDGYVGQEGKFSIDTSSAGDGNLVVMVHGPKGGFELRLTQDKKAKRMVWGSYCPSYPGNYLIDVMWADEHIPGSPFKVNIADCCSLPIVPHLGADVTIKHD